MQLKFKNYQLVSVQRFLYHMNFKKSKQTRARTKLIKLLDKKINEYQEDVKELIEKHGERDMGQLVEAKEGGYVLENKRAFEVDSKELSEEEVIIEGGEYVNNFKVLYDAIDAIEEFDNGLEGQEADGYDTLMDAFEAAIKKDEDSAE
ncbi:DUF1617 family protein [Sediminibacillus massiliensis]|uniref:DUF1617 family protein n=1 Tax=Sediminibacillus massiliensis TaxID=1926277 RepID=UPI0009885607|nr:DUF1617 family protein [Sediminibacillus massiliensis]